MLNTLKHRYWWITALALTLMNYSFPTMAFATSSRALPHRADMHGLSDFRSIDLMDAENRLYALVVAKENPDGPLNAYFVTSADHGATWDHPVRINAPGLAISAHRGNDAQLAVAGRHLAAVWQHRGETPGSAPMSLAYSSDGGRQWHAATPPKFDDPTETQSHFDLIGDKHGRFHMVWLDDREERGNTQGLRHAVSNDSGHHWIEQSAIDDAVCTCCWLRLNALANGNISVLYRDDEPHDMRLAVHSGSDKAWTQQSAVGHFDWQFAGCPHCGGGLTEVQERGRSVLHGVVWTGVETAAGIHYLQSRDAGLSWPTSQRLTDGQSREPDIAALKDGTLGIVYVAPGPDGNQVNFIGSRDRGKHWTKPKPISDSTRAADHPRILATSRGFRVFWTERQDRGPYVLAMAAPAIN